MQIPVTLIWGAADGRGNAAMMCAMAVASAGLVLVWMRALYLQVVVRNTTLVQAARWAIVALAVWTISWIGELGIFPFSRAILDHLWYAAAVLALCPLISVLGSRRPGIRVWTGFILLPLLCVLGWPVISVGIQSNDLRGLQLETPQLIAFLLVLIMGAGNYCGTRFTLVILSYGAACLIQAVSLSVNCPTWLTERNWAALIAILFLGGSALLASDFISPSPATTNRFDKLWLDFFDTFGLVWGRRIQDRVNHMAMKEQWPARLELHGFEWNLPNEQDASREATEARIEHTFRWLLRRFVDPPWIDQRLGVGLERETISALEADS